MIPNIRTNFCTTGNRTMTEIELRTELLEQLKIAAGMIGGPDDFSDLRDSDTVKHSINVPMWAVKNFRATIAKAEAAASDRDAGAAKWQAGYVAGVEACAKALEADARLCDCSAHEESECSCGAWCEWKSITSARAVEIVRAALQETER